MMFTVFLLNPQKAFIDMPLGSPGKLTQLGGEFIIGPGLRCDFAHRMTNTSSEFALKTSLSMFRLNFHVGK
jgi:hypothetical protein